MVRIKAYAKLNFTLDITGVKDGYHMLESLVCTVDMFDLIKLKKRRDGLINVYMSGLGSESLPPEKNIAVKAGEAYVKAFGTRGADITVYKNIPFGAGMGGSSADCAGVLNGMARLYGKGGYAQLKEIADSLGSDTGYLLTGGWAVISGRGEIVRPLNLKTRVNAVALVPESGVSTAECYALYDSLSGETKGGSSSSHGAEEALKTGDISGFGAKMGNDLYKPATVINPCISQAFKELEEFSPLGVNMSGSGSAVFAVFDTPELCEYVKSRYRGKCKCIRLKTVIPK